MWTMTGHELVEADKRMTRPSEPPLVEPGRHSSLSILTGVVDGAAGYDTNLA